MIVLTSFGEDERLFTALRAGAAGYLLKDVEPAELVRAIRTAHAGGRRCRPRSRRGWWRSSRAGAAGRAPADDLTPRELEVLCLIARGRSNKRIALELGVAEKTVKTHVSHVLAKLGLSDRTQAALYAVRRRARQPTGPRPNSRWWRGGSAPSLLGMPTAIVTGASRGLGLALSRALAERGWRLVIDAREAGPLEAAAAQLPGATPSPATCPIRATATRSSQAAGGADRPARQQRLAARAEPAAARSPTTRSTCSSRSTASTCSPRWR